MLTLQFLRKILLQIFAKSTLVTGFVNKSAYFSHHTQISTKIHYQTLKCRMKCYLASICLTLLFSTSDLKNSVADLLSVECTIS